MIKQIKSFVVNLIAGANIATILLMLLAVAAAALYTKYRLVVMIVLAAALCLAFHAGPAQEEYRIR